MFEKYQYLLLDRDGVINVHRENDYVRSLGDFDFTDKALEAISLLSQNFKDLFIVTNQRGVGRGLMSEENLNSIHKYLLESIKKANGRIEKIYTCTEVRDQHFDRKPNPGMAYQIKRDYPSIEFTQCIMVGDGLSDMEFGRRLGMGTVLIGSRYSKNHNIFNMVDAHFPDLYSFSTSF